MTEAEVMQGKELLTSKTFWGAVLTVLAMVLAIFGVHFDVSAVASGIVAVIGFALNIVGNVTRKGPITSIFGFLTAAGHVKKQALEKTQATSTEGPVKGTPASAGETQ